MRILKKIKASKVFLYAFLGIVTVVQIYPIIWMFFFSLKDNEEIFGGNVAGLPKNWLFGNYVEAWIKGNIGQYFINTLVVTALTILGTVLFAAMAAYAISRMKWKFQKTALTVFLLGMMIPIHAALLPLFLTYVKVGILNTYACLVLPYIAFNIPISVYIYVGFMEGIPKEMEESAFLDGCNIFKSFFRIILPMLKPVISTITILTFINAWNEFMFASVFITKSSMKTLTVGIQEMVGQFTTSWGPIGAALVLASFPTLIIYIFMSDKVQKGFMAGAVKG
ncbi:carbohydrate ABC transporter permease [Blautia marasmi]|uniref:carbohydrate ABC transporter permease n=1 Tax=Blautia marasmi TaxID=1917868 RepID=UPI0038BE115A